MKATIIGIRRAENKDGNIATSLFVSLPFEDWESAGDSALNYKGDESLDNSFYFDKFNSNLNFEDMEELNDPLSADELLNANELLENENVNKQDLDSDTYRQFLKDALDSVATPIEEAIEENGETLTNIYSILLRILKAITNLPENIFNLFKVSFSKIISVAENIYTAIVNLPNILIPGFAQGMFVN